MRTLAAHGPGGVGLAALPEALLGVPHIVLKSLWPPRGSGFVEGVGVSSGGNLHVGVSEDEFTNSGVQSEAVYS